MTREEAKKNLHYKLQFDTLNINEFIDSIYNDFEKEKESIYRYHEKRDKQIYCRARKLI